jgi:hypothetical protein
MFHRYIAERPLPGDHFGIVTARCWPRLCENSCRLELQHKTRPKSHLCFDSEQIY